MPASRASAHNILEIREIIAIEAVSRTRSFKHAAEAMNTSQPTLSRLVAAAERRLGCNLFRRGWSGADTTPQGDVAVRMCNLITAMIDDAQARLFSDPQAVPMLRYNLRSYQLQVIEAICREGSVTLAASRLGKSQPDISRTLNEFSKRFRLRLFQRTATGMTMLPPARILGDLGSSIAYRLDTLPDQLRTLEREFVGRVSVGMLPFSGQDLILRAFARITNAHPNVRLACVPGSYNSLIEALRRNEIDRIVGIMRGPLRPAGLDEEFLYNERYAVIVHQGHPLLAGTPDRKALAGTNWIVAPHGTPVRAYFETVLSRIGVTPPTQTCELLSFGSAEQMLLDSNSAAMLTYSTRKLRQLRGDLAEVRTGFPEEIAPIGVTRLKSAPADPALQEFDQILREVVSQQA